MSRDEDQEYFADGISEDIITDLSKVSALHVISRNTAFTFKGRSVEVPQIARQLNVTHVLEGSVRKSGTRVRITAQLIDGSMDAHVWADRWDRDLDDIFALQDEISRAIVAALKVKLLPAEKAAIDDRGTTSLQAYDKFLRARASFNSAATAPDMLHALELYSEAVSIDPDFVLPRIGMAYLLRTVRTLAPDFQDLSQFDALVDESLARAPDHWGTQAILGARLLTHRDWEAALSALGKAASQAPPSMAGVQVYLAYAFGALGRIEEGVRLWEAARSVDPLSILVTSVLGQWYLITGRTDDSRGEYERTQDLAGAREVLEQTALFRIWDLGNVEATRAQFLRLLDVQITPLPFLTKVMELLDRPNDALGVLRQAFSDSANQDGTRMAHVGWYAALLGDADLAVQALRKAVLEIGSLPAFTIWYPFLRQTRQTPAFKELIRDLGIYDYWRASGNWGDFARPLGDDDFEIIR
jgi:TolB-like protein